MSEPTIAEVSREAPTAADLIQMIAAMGEPKRDEFPSERANRLRIYKSLFIKAGLCKELHK